MADAGKDNKLIANLVVEKGLVPRAQIEQILGEIQESKPATRLIDLLVEKGLLSPGDAQTVLLEKEFIHPSRTGQTTIWDKLNRMPEIPLDLRDPTLPEDVRAAALNPDNDFAKYLLLRPIAKGGMAEIFLAWDKELSRYVVVKFLSFSSEEDIARFKREAQMQARLSHPNIVPIHDVGEYKGRHFIVMQYIDGKTIDEVRMDMRQVLRVVRDAAMALQHAHTRGIVHRDIKPNNIMIDKDGHVWVTDFGLAKSIKAEKNPKISQSGILVGTPAYMSPEQARNKPMDARSDVYSLGITMFELLTGHRPFDAEAPIDVVMKVINEDPPTPRSLNPKIPVDVETIVLKCIEKRMAKRYLSTRALAEDMDRFLNDEPILGRRPSIIYRLSKNVRRHRGTALGLLIATGAVLAAVGLWFRDERATQNVRQQLREGTELEKIHEQLFQEAAPMVQSVEDSISTGSAARFGVEGQPRLLEKLDQAIGGLSEVLKRDPKYQPAVQMMGHAYLLRGRLSLDRQDLDRARQNLDQAVALKPDSWHAYADRGSLELLEIVVDDIFREGLYPGPSPVPRVELKELSTAAIRDYEKASSLTSSEYDRHWLEAVLPFVRGDYAAATESLGTLLEFAGSNGVLWILRSIAHLRIGERDAAREHLARAKKLMPFSKVAMIEDARQALEQNDADRLVAAADALTRIDRTDPSGVLFRGLLRVRQKNLVMGFVDFSQAELMAPRNLLGHALRGYLRLSFGRAAEAVVDETNALGMARDKALRGPLLQARARAYAEQHDFVSALDDANEALRLSGNDAHARFTRGEVYFAAQRWDACVSDLDDVIKSQPGGPLRDRAETLRARALLKKR